MEISKDEAVLQIREAIYQVVGAEWADEMEITAEASLIDGIELDSIETSKVIEIMLKRHPQVDFESWFAAMNIERIMALTIGDIAEHIASQSRSSGVAP